MLRIQPPAALVAATSPRVPRGLARALKVFALIAIGMVCIDLCVELLISMRVLLTDAAAVFSDILRSLR